MSYTISPQGAIQATASQPTASFGLTSLGHDRMVNHAVTDDQHGRTRGKSERADLQPLPHDPRLRWQLRTPRQARACCQEMLETFDRCKANRDVDGTESVHQFLQMALARAQRDARRRWLRSSPGSKTSVATALPDPAGTKIIALMRTAYRHVTHELQRQT